MELKNNISLTANPKTKVLTIKINYGQRLEVDSIKAGKDVFANAYWKKLNDDYKLNLQLVSTKKHVVEKEEVEVEGIDL